MKTMNTSKDLMFTNNSTYDKDIIYTENNDNDLVFKINSSLKASSRDMTEEGLQKAMDKFLELLK